MKEYKIFDGIKWRLFETHDSPFINPNPVKWYFKRENICPFCKHCTDVWWDYTNGPYCFFCEYYNEIPKDCDKFEDIED